MTLPGRGPNLTVCRPGPATLAEGREERAASLRQESAPSLPLKPHQPGVAVPSPAGLPAGLPHSLLSPELTQGIGGQVTPPPNLVLPLLVSASSLPEP